MFWPYVLDTYSHQFPLFKDTIECALIAKLFSQNDNNEYNIIFAYEANPGRQMSYWSTTHKRFDIKRKNHPLCKQCQVTGVHCGKSMNTCHWFTTLVKAFLVNSSASWHSRWMWIVWTSFVLLDFAPCSFRSTLVVFLSHNSANKCQHIFSHAITKSAVGKKYLKPNVRLTA